LVDRVALPALERAGDPVEVARAYAEAGADEVMLVAREPPLEAILEILRSIRRPLTIPLVVWTNLRTAAEVGDILDAGAARVAVQSAALGDPDFIALLARRFGSEAIAVAITAGLEDEGWRVLDEPGGTATEWDAVTWARVVEAQNGGELIIESPGGGTHGEPYDLELLAAVTAGVKRPVVAAAGGARLEDLFDALMIGDADAVLVGSLLHSGKETVESVRAYLEEHGLGAG
jgi:cyclase